MTNLVMLKSSNIQNLIETVTVLFNIVMLTSMHRHYGPDQTTEESCFSSANPIALKTVKTPQSFGRSECNRVKFRTIMITYKI